MTKRFMRSSVVLACRRGVAVLGLGVAGVIVGAGVAAADDDALGSALTGDVSLEQTLGSATEPLLDTVGTTEQVLEPVVDVLEPAATVVEPVSQAIEPVTTAVQSDVSSLVDTVPVAEVVNPVVTVVDPVVQVVDPVVHVVDPVVETLDPVFEIVDPVVETLDPVVAIVDPVVETLDPVVKIVDPVVETLPAVHTPAAPTTVDAPAGNQSRDVEAADPDRVTSDSRGASTVEPLSAASAPTDTIHAGLSLVVVHTFANNTAAAAAVAHVRADQPTGALRTASVDPAPLGAPYPATSSSSAGVGGPTRGSIDAWSYDRLSLPASVAGSLAIAENLRAPRAPFLKIPTSPA